MIFQDLFLSRIFILMISNQKFFGKKALLKFENKLRLERGLSENTLSAYINDITKFKLYCLERNYKLENIDYHKLNEYLSSDYNQGLEKSSIKRKNIITQILLWLYQKRKDNRRKPCQITGINKN